MPSPALTSPMSQLFRTKNRAFKTFASRYLFSGWFALSNLVAYTAGLWDTRITLDPAGSNPECGRLVPIPLIMVLLVCFVSLQRRQSLHAFCHFVRRFFTRWNLFLSSEFLSYTVLHLCARWHLFLNDTTYYVTLSVYFPHKPRHLCYTHSTIEAIVAGSIPIIEEWKEDVRCSVNSHAQCVLWVPT